MPSHSAGSETRSEEPSARMESPVPSTPLDSPASTTHSAVGSGLTASVRTKLNFHDDKQWKKFSARRLELIHNLSLSSKKASEQDEEIFVVANSLREEYGFPPEYLPDFDKLVRAGIQSVRRNKKRAKVSSQGKSNDREFVFVPHKRYAPADDDYKRSSSPARLSPDDVHGADTHDTRRIPVTSLVSSPDDKSSSLLSHQSRSAATGAGPTLPSLSKLNLGTSYSPSNFSHSLERLMSYVSRVPLAHGTSNTEYLGMSVMNTAAALAVEKKFSGSDSAERVQVRIQSFAINSALARSLGCASLSALKLRLAAACREFGFDAVIHSLSSVYYELMDADPSFDFSLASTFERMAAMFPMLDPAAAALTATGGTRDDTHRTRTAYPSAPPSTVSTISASGGPGTPTIRPATVAYLDRKLHFTYDPSKNTPPTLAEVIDDGRRAFQINNDIVLRVRNVNLPNAFLDTDSEVSEAFSRARIDLELAPADASHAPKPTSNSGQRFQQLL